MTPFQFEHSVQIHETRNATEMISRFVAIIHLNSYSSKAGVAKPFTNSALISNVQLDMTIDIDEAQSENKKTNNLLVSNTVGFCFFLSSPNC